MTNMTDKAEENRRRILVSETVLLAILTAGSYWIAFVYEAGYLKTFGLPLNLIQIKIETILLVFFALVGGLYVLFLVTNLLSILWPKHPVLSVKLLRIAGFIILFPIWHLIRYGYRKEDLWYYLFTIGLVVVLEFIYPLVVYHNRKGILEKFIAEYESEAPTIERGILYRLLTAMGKPLSSLVVTILILSWLSFTLGEAKAHTTESYYVMKDSNLAVIRVYPDVVYCIQFNPRTKEIVPNLVLITPKEKGKIELIMKKIGPLKFKQEHSDVK